ncbi:hypothetical protein U1Q18_049389 [Sarracenia purpurea var. burkii]
MGYIQGGHCIEAIKILYAMKAAGLQPQESLLNEVRFTCGSRDFVNNTDAVENGFADNEDRLLRTDISWFLEVGHCLGSGRVCGFLGAVSLSRSSLGSGRVCGFYRCFLDRCVISLLAGCASLLHLRFCHPDRRVSFGASSYSVLLFGTLFQSSWFQRPSPLSSISGPSIYHLVG